MSRIKHFKKVLFPTLNETYKVIGDNEGMVGIISFRLVFMEPNLGLLFETLNHTFNWKQQVESKTKLAFRDVVVNPGFDGWRITVKTKAMVCGGDVFDFDTGAKICYAKANIKMCKVVRYITKLFRKLFEEALDNANGIIDWTTYLEDREKLYLTKYRNDDLTLNHNDNIPY